MKYRHAAAFASALALSLTLTVPTGAVETTLVPKTISYQDQFTDVRNAWCGPAVKTCYETELLQGKTADRFAPADSLTGAQAAVMAARLCSRLGGPTLAEPVPGQPWYENAFALLLQTVDEESDTYALNALQAAANAPCTRGQFAQLLLMALRGADVELPEKNHLEQATPDLTPEMPTYTLYQAGVLNGVDKYGTFNSSGHLNRGQAAAMLARIADPSLRMEVSLAPFDLCRDVLGLSPDTVVMTIDGRDISAVQFTGAICRELRTQYNKMICDGPQANDLKQALDNAAHSMKLDLAMEQLAAKRGISRSPETFYAGYHGLSATAGAWALDHTGLYQELLAIYLEEHGSTSAGASPHAVPWGQECLDSNLRDLADNMELVLSEDLTALDLSAAQVRLIAAPGYLG